MANWAYHEKQENERYLKCGNDYNSNKQGNDNRNNKSQQDYLNSNGKCKPNAVIVAIECPWGNL